MSNFLDAIKEGFNEGREKAKTETSTMRIRDDIKVIVFETTGEIKLATLCGDSVCSENLTEYTQCPQELLDCIPPEIVKLCKATAPHYLRITKDEQGNIKWE